MPSRPMPQSEQTTSRSRDVLEREAHQLGDLVRRLDLERVVVDHADADFFSRDLPSDRLEIHRAGARRLEGDHVGVDLVQHSSAGL